MKSKIYIFATMIMMVALLSSCKEDPIVPNVVTKDATGIKGDYATLHGEVRNMSDGEDYKCGFFYDVSVEMSNPKEIKANANARFSAKVTGLLSNTTYYYKAYIQCSAGQIEGETLTFTSQAAWPSVETRPASDVTGNGATLNAVIPSNGGSEITSCGFYYSTSESMSNKATAQFTGTPDSLFSVSVSGLSGNTTYYYKAFAKNAFGTAEGEILQFTTGIGTPTVQTSEATNITGSSATLVGNVISDGGATVTERGFVYGTSASDLSQTIQSGSGMGSFTKALTGLSLSTTYYYKAYATNIGGTSYGDVMTFTTTAASLPTVTTGSATPGIENVTLFGNVTSEDNATVTARGFVYGTSASNLSQTVQSGSGTGSFTKAITGLSQETTYYYKAYATNSEGTGYGEVLSFTTYGISDPTGYINGHGYVDLGLPSGTKWATCNVGASTPTAYGNYYAWGETTTKSTYNWSTYRYCNGNLNSLTKYCNSSEYGNDGFTDALTTLEAMDDAATANWGTAWRMPTKAELEELESNCTVIWTNAGTGHLFIGPNGNSVFLPLAGYRSDSGLFSDGHIGIYWSSSLDTYLPYHARYLEMGPFNYDDGRLNGRSVRAVCQP
ncbi:MAG: hypothetical protein J6S84_09135 [Bacteroidales bacterium]|nr:hypothetical protein [Bacteroidales bacterium]MBO7652854.1 hypothetical protein [Bacteroidales bacterium]